MKQITCVLAGYLALASVASPTRQPSVPKAVASKGETMIVSGGTPEARVAIVTREVNIGKPSDVRPNVINSSCTYSRFPCSVVDSIRISVAGRAIFVPRSVSCNVADVLSAELENREQVWILTLRGGDASESYVATVIFSADGVMKKTLASALSPNGVLEETAYRFIVVGD